MSFGCGVTAAKLAAPGAPRSKNSIPYDRACEEFGDERASVSDNLDTSRSHMNTYSFPEGCGTSGAALADWFVRKRDEYSAKRQAEGGRKLSALAPVGGAFIITPDEEEVATWDAKTRERFVKDALESLGIWMGHGKRHEPDAYAVHVDEGAMAERGLTRSDELGDCGLHIHVADRMLTEDGRYLSRETMSPGRIREMHRVFVREMKSRGWDITEHKSAAQHKRDGDEVLPAGMSANKFKRVRKWETKKKRELQAEREGLDADKSQLAEGQAALAEGQSQLADDREALESDREQLGLDQQALEDAQARLKADEDAHAMRVMRSHRALDRARAANAIDREGWEPPTTAKLFTPAQLAGNALALWRLVYEGNGSGLTGDWADLSRYEDESGELDVERARALLDTAMTGALGGDAKGCAVTSAEGAWWVTDVPASARDELYESDRAQAVRRYARDELEPRLLVLNERGEDVNELLRGVEGRSDLVAQCIQQLEVDQRSLDERAAELRVRETELDERSANLDRELAEKRHELRLANAELDRANRDAASVRSAAERDAADIRAAAERDAANTRADARARAYSEAKDEAAGRIEQFLGGVVGRASSIAYHVLAFMRREMDLGPAFDAAAKTCMDTLNSLSDQDVRDAQWGADPKASNTNRIQRGVARFFREKLSGRLDEVARESGSVGTTSSNSHPARERGGGYGDSGAA